MSKSVYDRGLLKPSEIACLQRVFDAACDKRQALPGSEDAREIALTILALHNAGMTGEADLLDAVSFPRPTVRSA